MFDVVVRVALALGAVPQDPEPAHLSVFFFKQKTAYEIEATGEPLTVRRNVHRAAGTGRARLHHSYLSPAAREVGELLLLGPGFRRCGRLRAQHPGDEQRDGGE